MSEKDYFLEARKKFEEKHGFVTRIFGAVGGLQVEPRRAWANLLFFRLAMVGNSMLTLCLPELRHQQDRPTDMSVLDHSSIAALGRTLLEAWLMFAYMSEPTVSEEEWLLRRSVLELHDVAARYRVLKDIGDLKEAQEYRDKMEALRKAIESSPVFKNLVSERQKKVLSGQELYLHGLRAVVKQAGWDVDHFNAMYAALSSHAHSAPISFYRSVLNPGEPAAGVAPDHQYVTSGLALEYATEPLGFACERMFHLYPEVFLTGQTKH